MNTAQKIHYIQSEYDEQDRKECAITQRQLEIINDFKSNGFTGSRFFPSDTVKDVIYDAIDKQTAELLTAMYMTGDDEQRFLDAAFAVKKQINDLIHEKAYELAVQDYNDKEEI